MLRSLRRLALGSACWLALASPALADPAMLDPSFGSGGISDPVLPEGPGGANAAVRQADGKIVAAGCIVVTDASGTTCHYALARYDTSGALDASLGVGGVVLGNWANSRFSDVALQADGRIVAAGELLQAMPVPGGTALEPLSLLARFEPDGSDDMSFGTNGRVVVGLMSYPLPTSFFKSLLILPSGKLIAAGTNGFNQAVVARFLADGTLDPTFSGDGWTPVQAGYVNSVALDPDSNLILAGGTGPGPSSSNDTTLARVDASGVPDPTFGTGGVRSVDVSALAGGSGDDRAFSVVVEPGGKLVTAGLAAGRPTLVRWLPGGDLDPSFGVGGIAQATQDGSANDLVRTTRGKFVVAVSHALSSYSSNFQITRFLPNGTLDASFGPDGSLVTPIGIHDNPREVIVVSATALLVGEADPYSSSRFTLVRYTVDDEIPPPVSSVSGKSAAVIAISLAWLGWRLLRRWEAHG